jgi:hypothetical protein|tara:strand:+ start:316 stop:789 length:474 start_codon:yes stop_codon:yes gene_type:complete
MTDARFEDGADTPLRLIAFSVEDLQVISSLVQDAVLPIGEMQWSPGKRRFAMLLNRFRWEDIKDEKSEGQAYERVQSVLAFEDVQNIQTQSIDRKDDNLIISILEISFYAVEDGMGFYLITLAGDGVIRLNVEALEVTLQDVTSPYKAPSGLKPNHL